MIKGIVGLIFTLTLGIGYCVFLVVNLIIEYRKEKRMRNSGYYIEDDRLVYIRVCDCCGKEMTEGYCIHDGEEYFCSDDCLHSTYSEEEYEQLCETHEGYWTEWRE